MADFVNAAVSASDFEDHINPADPDAIERRFLFRFSDAHGGTGEGDPVPQTKFHPVGKQYLFHIKDQDIKFIEPPKPGYLLPAGDSELLEPSSTAVSTYTEDDIQLGESATDWQFIKRCGPSSSLTPSVSVASRYFNIDEILLPPEFQDSRREDRGDLTEDSDSAFTVGNWADQIPVIPFKCRWTFDDFATTVSNLLFAGIGVVLFYRIFKRRCCPFS